MSWAGGKVEYSTTSISNGAVMNVSTRHELQTLLDNIRVTQGTAEGSSLAYRVAWIGLVGLPFLAAGVLPLIRESFWSLPIILILGFFVQALYVIIQYKVNKRLRPILEALLFVPEEPAKQEVQIAETTVKKTKARPSSGWKK
jgi:hypothetical protein